jgi:hypothetical protein
VVKLPSLERATPTGIHKKSKASTKKQTIKEIDEKIEMLKKQLLKYEKEKQELLKRRKI